MRYEEFSVESTEYGQRDLDLIQTRGVSHILFAANVSGVIVSKAIALLRMINVNTSKSPAIRLSLLIFKRAVYYGVYNKPDRYRS